MRENMVPLPFFCSLKLPSLSASKISDFAVMLSFIDSLLLTTTFIMLVILQYVPSNRKCLYFITSRINTAFVYVTVPIHWIFHMRPLFSPDKSCTHFQPCCEFSHDKDTHFQACSCLIHYLVFSCCLEQTELTNVVYFYNAIQRKRISNGHLRSIFTFPVRIKQMM